MKKNADLVKELRSTVQDGEAQTKIAKQIMAQNPSITDMEFVSIYAVDAKTRKEAVDKILASNPKIAVLAEIVAVGKHKDTVEKVFEAFMKAKFEQKVAPAPKKAEPKAVEVKKVPVKKTEAKKPVAVKKAQPKKPAVAPAIKKTEAVKVAEVAVAPKV